jgi:hypothetical protein
MRTLTLNFTGRGFLVPFEVVSFRWAWGGLVCSVFSDQAQAALLAVVALNLVGSASGWAAILTAQAVPRILLIVVGGVSADRHHLQAILRVGNALQALALVSIAALDHIGVLSVPDLYAFAIVYGALAAFTAPAADSLMPSLLPPELVRRAQLGSRTRGSWRTAMHPVSHAAMPRIFSTCSPPSTSGSTWYCYVPRSAARSKRRELLVSTRSTAHRPGSGRQTTRVSWRS